MTPYSLKNCIDDGLIRKIPKSMVRSENSFKTAAKWLVEAETTLKAGAYNSSTMCSYLVMFHSARAILYRDGYREKSHYCLARYLEERYAAEGLEHIWVDLFDHYRDLRHRNQYDVDLTSTEKEAQDALEAASRFLDRIKKL